MSLQVAPATKDRFDHVAALLAPRRPGTPAFSCLTYRVTSSEFNRLRGEERPARLRSFFDAKLAPGVIAYDDGVPVGWCAFGPRSEMGRLQRSKTIPQIEDHPVVSIVCFVVCADHRRQGVARLMLEAATDYLATHNVQTVEQYPIVNDGRTISGSFAYVGWYGRPVRELWFREGQDHFVKHFRNATVGDAAGSVAAPVSAGSPVRSVELSSAQDGHLPLPTIGIYRPCMANSPGLPCGRALISHIHASRLTSCSRAPKSWPEAALASVGGVHVSDG